MSDFDGLVAIVTGGAGGIGQATAEVLESRGATVAILDLATGCDVGDTASVNAAVASVIDRHGRLDILINNAGIGAAGDVTANDDAEWHHVLDVNVLGMVRTTRAALPYLEQRSGRVVTVASTRIFGRAPRSTLSPSCSAWRAVDPGPTPPWPAPAIASWSRSLPPQKSSLPKVSYRKVCFPSLSISFPWASMR